MKTSSTKPLRSGLAAPPTLEECQAMPPVWARTAVASRVTGISRTQLFELIALGKIESRHIKRPGRKRGIRLIKVSSLLAYIEGADK